MLKEAIFELMDSSPFSSLAVIVGIKAAVIELGDFISPEVEQFISRAESYAIQFVDHMNLDGA